MFVRAAFDVHIGTLCTIGNWKPVVTGVSLCTTAGTIRERVRDESGVCGDWFTLVVQAKPGDRFEVMEEGDERTLGELGVIAGKSSFYIRLHMRGGGGRPENGAAM